MLTETRFHELMSVSNYTVLQKSLVRAHTIRNSAFHMVNVNMQISCHDKKFSVHDKKTVARQLGNMNKTWKLANVSLNLTAKNIYSFIVL